MLKSKFPIFGTGGVSRQPTFDAEFKNAKIKISHFQGGGVSHRPTFDAEFKNAQIQISIWGGSVASQLLMLSSKMLKSKFPILVQIC